MARPLRIEYEGALYHITARGNERKNIFFSKSDYEKFLHYVKEAKKKFGIKLHAYVLMSNHFHLVVETPEANLSKTMHYINGSDDPYKNVYGGIILGGTTFIRETLKIIKVELLQKDEIAHSRKLKTGYGIEEIVDCIARFNKISKEEIVKNNHKELRKLTIYFIKKNTGATNRQIGEYFEGIQSSAVSKIVERISSELVNNRKLRKEIDKIERKMSHVEN